MGSRFAATGAGSPERLTQIEGEFLVGSGVVLWKPEQVVLDPLTLVQHFTLLEVSTGCVHELASLGESIGSELLDDRHVYWKSFNGLGASSPGDPEPLVPLLRVNLRTGAFERVLSPGFDVTLASDFMAEDETNIYLRPNATDTLVALRKPD